MLYTYDNIDAILKTARKNKKYIETIQLKELESEIPTNLLVAIFLVESTMRPIYFRLLEYGVLCFESLLSLAFKRTVKNYTIGRFQIGLSYILNFNGGNIYSHVDRIPCVSFRNALTILESIKFDRQINIVVFRILPLIRQASRIYPHGHIYRDQNIYTYVGEQYNGRYAYGLLISQIVEALSVESYPAANYLQVAP